MPLAPAWMTALGLMLLFGAAAPGASAQSTSPNFLVVLTDDQRWDTLWAMPILQEKLVSRGVVFTNAITTTPLCCPFRASFLAGGYFAHNTSVLTNDAPNGGVTRFNEAASLALSLQAAGYQSFLVGKYINEYHLIAPHVPPGWTRFYGLIGGRDLVFGSSGALPTVGQALPPYSGFETDHYTSLFEAWLAEAPREPFFAYYSVDPPHWPATPAPGDESLFPAYVYRERGYGEADLGDKPSFVQSAASDHGSLTSSLEEEDEFHRDQLRSLQAVDRAVGALFDLVEQLGALDRTVFVFTSDNGLMWGEHGQFGKHKPYEESIRVPLVVVAPGTAARSEEALVSVDLDVPATLLALAGLPVTGDGLNLAPLLEDPQAPWREELLVEAWRNQDLHALRGAWSGLRTRTATQEWKYVERPGGVRELYDLTLDPFELESRHADAAYTAVLDDLAARLAPLKGLQIATSSSTVPTGFTGQPFSFELSAWGGSPPYSWRVAEGTLPPGLVLEAATGRIVGVPTQAVIGRQVWIEVADAAAARHSGLPQSHALRLQFTIHRGGRACGVGFGLALALPLLARARARRARR